MTREWEINYDIALGDVYFHAFSYSVASGNQFTQEVIPDNSTLSDHKKKKQVGVSISAIFIGDDFQSRYDALKELEDSDDTYDFYVRPKFEGGKREFIRNCGIETITKEVGAEENCIYCTIVLKQISKGSVAVSKTSYEAPPAPVPKKEKKPSNVKLEPEVPSEVEKEKAVETLTEEKYGDTYLYNYVDDYYDGGAAIDYNGDESLDSGGLL
ncbi:hypothetical protein PM10SUCC1_32320 [Propionigenium maris DSM 9537]|uniref:Dit-like phage tail protein N-terminal domain-containing protein n=1 Tax=Propionigenium maris DSM 9537 TaxID=1123000 RepID=A0A9W6GND0_9FUSO|nr:hypothetical protein [Propionigenium maris]GLI57718.1 hypothetical protein PM10SUCC1_32320 [Propionigenium maris DSM 9537]